MQTQTEDTPNQASPLLTARGQRVPGDIVNKATSDLPDNQRSAIRRFHALYMEQNLSIDEAAKLIRKDGSTLSLVFRGKYNAALDKVVEEIESYFDLSDKRSAGRKVEFIKTKLTTRIWQVCDVALELQRWAYIFGESQIGKTEALLAYARAHNHGSTIYIAMPTGGALGNFLTALAKKLRISPQLRESELRQRIIEAFDDRMLLIIDEASRCIPQGGRGNAERRVASIEFTREIFDESHCGVVVCATNIFRDEMEDGILEKILRQSKRRRAVSMVLDDIPTPEDLNTFAAAYGLAPAEGKALELQNLLCGDEALGMWLTLLRLAAKTASDNKQKMAWAHVLSAEKGLCLLEGRKSRVS
jgi:hypothetical protein